MITVNKVFLDLVMEYTGLSKMAIGPLVANIHRVKVNEQCKTSKIHGNTYQSALNGCRNIWVAVIFGCRYCIKVISANGITYNSCESCSSVCVASFFCIVFYFSGCHFQSGTTSQIRPKIALFILRRFNGKDCWI